MAFRYALVPTLMLLLAAVLLILWIDNTCVYIFRGTANFPPILAPTLKINELPPAHPDLGGVAVADLDGDGSVEFILTGPKSVAVISTDGKLRWKVTARLRFGRQLSLHSPGIQLTDVDGDGGRDILYLTEAKSIEARDGRTGEILHRSSLPRPTAGAEWWSHLALARFQRHSPPVLLLQAVSEGPWPKARYLTAFRLSDVLQHEQAAKALWSRTDFQHAEHSGVRVADLDDDGTDEIIGGEIADAKGRTLTGRQFIQKSHVDAVIVADIRPDLPGLEVVLLEERKHKFRHPQHVALLRKDETIWLKGHGVLEPQNAAIGNFDTSSPGREIWLRSGQEKDQTPWVLSASGKLISDYAISDHAPKGWTVKGLEVIQAIHWTGSPKQLAVAKARHQHGDVAIFDAMTGSFQALLKTKAYRLLVADVQGDWREEIIVRTPTGLEIFENKATNLNPHRRRLWEDLHYGRSKVSWNYYNPQ